MARFFQEAQKAYNDTEDRIYQKRKQNREDFLAYRKMKAEMGEEVTAEELNDFRQSLAGSDAFFLKSLPSGALMSEMADRTNQRAIATRLKEDQEQIGYLEKQNAAFDNFIGYNLDAGDITDQKTINKLKGDFIKGFPENPELGERLWDQNSGRLAEIFQSKQNDTALAYADNNLKNVTTVAEADSIMDAQGVAEWKKNAIRPIIQRRQNEETSTAVAKADSNVVNYDGSKLRFLPDDKIDAIAAEIIAGAEVPYKTTDEEYKKLHARLVASLKLRRDQADLSQADVDTRAFETAMNSKDNPFVQSVLARGYDEEDLLQTYNMQARLHNQPEAESVEDDTFKFWREAAERVQGINYQTEYDAEQVKAQTQAEAALKTAIDRIDAVANHPLMKEETSGRFAIEYLKAQGYVFVGEPVQIINSLVNQFGEDALTGKNTEKAQEMIAWLKGNGAVQTQQQYLIQEKAKHVTKKIPPGTRIEQYVVDGEAEYLKAINQKVEAMVTRILPFGATDEEIDNAHQKIRDWLTKQIDLDTNVALSSPGAFRGDEIQQPLAELKTTVLKSLETTLKNPSSRTPRPPAPPTTLFKLTPRGYYIAQGGSGSVIDANGNPVTPGLAYNYDQATGKLTPYAPNGSTARQLPQLYTGATTGVFNTPVPTMQITQAGYALANVQSLQDEVLGFTPNPNYTVRPGGPFDTPLDYVASIVLQMGEAYRAQGQQITDREIYIALGRPAGGQYGYGLTDDTFDNTKRTP